MVSICSKCFCVVVVGGGFVGFVVVCELSVVDVDVLFIDCCGYNMF